MLTAKITRRDALRTAAAFAATALPVRAAGNALKAAWVNHYIYLTPNLKKTTDWYEEVFNMRMGIRNVNEAHMWFSDSGNHTCMIVRQAPAGVTATKIVNFAFTLEHWDDKAVEEELRRRGLNPVADTAKCFRFRDQEGFEIAVCAKDFLKAPSGSPGKPALWQAVSANHIVELSPSYGKLRDWYKDLLDLRVSYDSGRDVYMWFGDTVWIPTQTRNDGANSAALGTLDHVAYTIADFKKDEVEAELKKRNLNPRLDTELSFNCVDINGFKTQVCDKQLVPVAEKRPPR